MISWRTALFIDLTVVLVVTVLALPVSAVDTLTARIHSPNLAARFACRPARRSWWAAIDRPGTDRWCCSTRATPGSCWCWRWSPGYPSGSCSAARGATVIRGRGKSAIRSRDELGSPPHPATLGARSPHCGSLGELQRQRRNATPRTPTELRRAATAAPRHLTARAMDGELLPRAQCTDLVCDGHGPLLRARGNVRAEHRVHL